MKCTEPCCNKWKRKYCNIARMVPSICLLLWGLWELSLPIILGGLSLVVMQQQANRMEEALDDGNRPWY